MEDEGLVSQQEQPEAPPPHWFHTLQVRRQRGRRGRSNSDPLVELCADPPPWVRTHLAPPRPPGPHLTFTCSPQKPALQFGAAHSYVSLEKLGEGAYACVYKGISRYRNISRVLLGGPEEPEPV